MRSSHLCCRCYAVVCVEQYSLISGFWRLLFAKSQYKLLILGLDDSGKTTLLEQLRHIYTLSPPPASLLLPPTVGLNIGRFDVDHRSHLTLWDLGGQEGLRVLWDKYYSDCHALIYVVDSSDRGRVSESVREMGKLMADRELDGVPVLLYCNKQDVDGAMRGDEVEREMRDGGGLQRTMHREVRVQEISALNGDGIEKGVEWLLNVLPKAKRTKLLAERML